MNNKPYSYRHVRTRKGEVRYKRKLKERFDHYNSYPGVTEETSNSGKVYYKEWVGKFNGKKFYKRYANRIARKSKDLSNGGGFKKAYDLWNALS